MDDEHLRQRKTDDETKKTEDDKEKREVEVGNSSSSKDDPPEPVPDPTPKSNSIPTETKPLSEKEAYFTMLRLWLQQVNRTQSASACFPYYLAANYPNLVNGIGTPSSTGNIPTQSTTNPVVFPAFPPPPPGYQPQQQQWFLPMMPNGIVGGMQPPIPGQPADIQQPVQQPAQPNGAALLFDQFRQRNNNVWMNNAQRSEEIIQQHGGYEFIIAPLWKRFVAEIIDIALLFLIRLMLTFMFVDIFQIDLEGDLDALRNSLEDDYTDVLAFTTDLLFFEVFTKIGICFYEALWTATGVQRQIGGATPGKIIMGLRIIHADAVVPLQPQLPGIQIQNTVPMRALIHPAKNLGFRRALLRAIAKNVLMALLFPMCFFLFLFRNNQTGYDLVTKTIVVEENANPVLRRR